MAFRPELRPLNPEVAARDDVGLGCAPIGNLFAPVPDGDAVATVQAALARDVRFFDTAPLYGSGESERKLARMGGDRVDVLHLHDPLDVEAAFATALPALAELRDEGVVRAISVGLGRLDPLERYVAEAPLDVVMEAGRLTLLDRTALNRLLPTAAARGIGVLAAAVFNSGILVDPVGSPFFEYKPAPPELRERAQRLQAMCAAYGVRLADAAVQFPLRQGADAVVVGARTPAEVDAFVDGLDAVLPAALWDALDAEAA